ncbi:hypothetical protein CsSME_00050312 [Camellia sinensis var. sinensis]
MLSRDTLSFYRWNVTSSSLGLESNSALRFTLSLGHRFCRETFYCFKMVVTRSKCGGDDDDDDFEVPPTVIQKKKVPKKKAKVVKKFSPMLVMMKAVCLQQQNLRS